MNPLRSKGLPKYYRQLATAIASYGYEGLSLDMSRNSKCAKKPDPPRTTTEKDIGKYRRGSRIP